jgi:alpha-glucosidase
VKHPLPRRARRGLTLTGSVLLALTLQTSVLAADTRAHASGNTSLDGGASEIHLGDQMAARFITDNIVQIRFTGAEAATTAPLVLDPAGLPVATAQVRDGKVAGLPSLLSAGTTISWDQPHHSLLIEDTAHHGSLRIDIAALQRGQLQLHHAGADALYGIGGYNATENVSAGLLRQGKQIAEAGEQGHAGAPFVWSTAGYGVLLGSDGASFRLKPGVIEAKSPHKHMDVYILLGTPAQLFGSLARLSGHTPLFPKWAMGFTNSQWGIDQKELLQIVDTYRAKHIPIDNFTLDFDWKAWGEDNYGEFRWNPAKFPDGPSGKLAEQLRAKGMQITGIMKPRLHVDTVEGRYATAHDFWVPGEKVSDDYFSHKPVKNIDFDIAAARTWFGNLAVKYGFDKGIAGWWNDEADTTGSDTEFMNMQRALYDAQRAVSSQRVWSVNRNFWLGSQRYAYGLWSGDISTGFPSMAGQRARMLSAINVGAMQWGMDGGGFKDGTPTPENYARWIEFGAFTPIFRVHGVFGEKRQPWVYGAVAEKAATDAIRLRYALIPYIYSYEDARRQTGLGLVRPLLFDWPNDARVRNDVDAWMFGESLLVAPIVQPGQTATDVYLPAGQWTDWFSGKTYTGGTTAHLAVDAKSWSDIPLFVREGAIIPTQPAMDYVGQKPLTQVAVEMFPSTNRTSFNYYDDNGSTYDYEKGAFFRQSLSLQRTAGGVRIETGEVAGSYQPALKLYLFKVHGGAANAVSGNGKSLPHFDSLDALTTASGQGWATGTDRFGAVTWIRVAASQGRTLALALRHPSLQPSNSGQSRM